MSETRDRLGRREVLAGAGSAIVAGVAGCLSGPNSGGENGDDDGGNGDDNGGNGDGGNGDDGGSGDDGTDVDVQVFVEANQFNEQVVEMEPGGTIRWQHIGGTHTLTFYHEDNDRQHRVPEGAPAVDENVNDGATSHEVTLDQPGVYDYHCQPHENSDQMVGTIVVGSNDDPDQPGLKEPNDDIPTFAGEKLMQLNDEARAILGI